MSDDLISEEALCQKIDKIKVSSAEIVVHGTKEKPYYEIKYFDLSNNETHIGYSSYNLDYVFKWLEECFEIVNGEKRSDRSRNQTVDDLISRKALLKKLEVFNALKESGGVKWYRYLDMNNPVIRWVNENLEGME